MIILFGTRMVKSASKKFRVSYCPQCNSPKILGSYFARRWFHLFYIPLFPIQRKQYYLDVCPSCKMGKVLEEDKLPAIRQQLADKTGLLVDKYLEGGGRFSDDNTANHDLKMTMVLNMETLAVLGSQEALEGWMNRLTQGGFRGLAALTKAILLGSTKQWAAARKELEESITMGGGDYLSYYQMGILLMINQKFQEASQFFSKAMEHVENKLEALRENLTALFQGRLYQGYIELFEQTAPQYPQFKAHKQFYNRYKTACRREKRPPQIMQ